MLALHGWALDPDLGGDAPARLLDRLVARGLPFALDGARRPLFDPAEAIDQLIALGLAGAEPAWRACFVATGRRLARTLDPGAPAGVAVAPRAFRVTFARHFDLATVAARGSLRLRLPRPVEDAGLTGLQLDIDAPAGIPVVETPGRIELRLTAPLPPETTAGWTARFTSRPAAPGPATLDDADRALWLAPDEGFVQVTPRVVALAADLAGTLRDDAAILAAFRAFLLDHLACGVVAYEAIRGAATDHVLATRWYDCQLGAALLAALCRARGIPARLVGGYLLWPALPARHYWAEVWLGGWQRADPIAWELSAGGRDRDWRAMFDRLDHRLRTEVLPNATAGPMSLPFPAAHHRLLRRVGEGIAIDHRAVATGRRIYRDTIRVTPDPA